MPARPIRGEGGKVIGIVHVRMRRPRTRCAVCRQPGATQSCDGRTRGEKTCDAALCRECSVRPRAGVDFCPTHRDQAAGWSAEAQP